MRSKIRVPWALLILVLLIATLAGTTAILANSGRENVSHKPPAPSGRPMESLTSLADAEAILGAAIPTPAYLPKGYKIQNILVAGKTNVALLFSDKKITPNMKPRLSGGMWESEFKRPGGVRLVLDMQKVGKVANPDFWADFEAGRISLPGEVVDLGYVKGRLVDPMTIERPTVDSPDIKVEYELDNIWYLEWSHSTFMFTLKAPKDMSRDEVLKIASSVPALVSSFKEVSVEEVESILGVAVPTLDLPNGYQIRTAFAVEDDTAYLLISDTEISTGKVQTLVQLADIVGRLNKLNGVKIVLKIDTILAQAACPGYDLIEVFSGQGEVSDFGGGKAIVRDGNGYHDVEWFTQEAHFRLKACGESLLSDEVTAIVISGGSGQ